MAQDFGIKISKPRYSAIDGGDIDMVFSSSWPSISIAVDETVTGPTNLSHDLGFPPLTFLFGGGLRLFPNVTKDHIQVPSGDYHVIAYNLDLSVEKEYPFVNPPAIAGGYDSDYGIKIVKEGKDIDSTDMRDFVLHSRCQAPQVLAVKTETSIGDYVRSDSVTINNAISYTNPQGYVPWVFGYAGFNPGVLFGGIGDGNVEYVFGLYASQAYPRTFIDKTNNTAYITTSPGNADYASLVILRDPLFVAAEVAVTY